MLSNGNKAPDFFQGEQWMVRAHKTEAATSNEEVDGMSQMCSRLIRHFALDGKKRKLVAL